MKKIGMQPIPMMDRDKKDEVPQGQVRPALSDTASCVNHILACLQTRAASETHDNIVMFLY